MPAAVAQRRSPQATRPRATITSQPVTHPHPTTTRRPHGAACPAQPAAHAGGTTRSAIPASLRARSRQIRPRDRSFGGAGSRS
jgi:hypothetical protein